MSTAKPIVRRCGMPRSNDCTGGQRRAVHLAELDQALDVVAELPAGALLAKAA